MSARVGVIGVGRMGMAICARLAGAGIPVAATDRRAEREREVCAAGARWLSSTPALLEASDIVLTVLPGPAEVEEVMAVAMARLRPGMAWLDMTSSDPRLTRALVERAAARGAETLDVALGGGVPAAQAGTLQLFTGGEATVVERHRPLLETLGDVEHVGGSGAGQLVKLLVNLLWFGQAVAVGEALLVARGSGLDLDVIAPVLARSAAAGEFVHRDLPRLLSGDYLDSFGIDRSSAEIDTVTSIAGGLGVPFAVSTAVRDAYRAAVQRYGAADGELLAVALLEEQAGIALRGGSGSGPAVDS